MAAKQRGFLRRVVRGLFGLLISLLLLSVLAVAALRWIHPPTSAFMLSSRVEALLAGNHDYRLRFRWANYRDISAYAPLAVIASEDQKFPDHWGFDFKSIDESLREHRDGKRLRGASTLTQQVAKNLFLWQSGSFVRKGLEAYLTLLIETFLPKQRILEIYLNIAEFGHGIYGVQAAAEYFFHEPAARLSAAQSALLAAVLPNPIRFKVNAPSRYILSRQQWILHQMQSLGGRDYLEAVQPAK